MYWIDLGSDGILSTSASLKYLQFAAKLHEISMMASISFILLSYLHATLLRHGISFGHLDAPYIIGAGGGAGLLLTSRTSQLNVLVSAGILRLPRQPSVLRHFH